MSPEKAYSILEFLSKIGGNKLEKFLETSVYKKEKRIADKVQKNYSFKEHGIKIGDKIHCIIDGKDYVVCDDTHIKFRNQKKSLLYVAYTLKKWKTARGPAYFEYNGKLLSDL